MVQIYGIVMDVIGCPSSYVDASQDGSVYREISRSLQSVDHVVVDIGQGAISNIYPLHNLVRSTADKVVNGIPIVVYRSSDLEHGTYRSTRR